jgi:hypothetical protein
MGSISSIHISDIIGFWWEGGPPFSFFGEGEHPLSLSKLASNVETYIRTLWWSSPGELPESAALEAWKAMELDTAVERDALGVHQNKVAGASNFMPSNRFPTLSTVCGEKWGHLERCKRGVAISLDILFFENKIHTLPIHRCGCSCISFWAVQGCPRNDRHSCVLIPMLPILSK